MAGKRGGGAALTPFGETLVARFRAIEKAATKAAAVDMKALQAEIEAGQAAR